MVLRVDYCFESVLDYNINLIEISEALTKNTFSPQFAGLNLEILVESFHQKTEFSPIFGFHQYLSPTYDHLRSMGFTTIPPKQSRVVYSNNFVNDLAKCSVYDLNGRRLISDEHVVNGGFYDFAIVRGRHHLSENKNRKNSTVNSDAYRKMKNDLRITRRNNSVLKKRTSDTDQ